MSLVGNGGLDRMIGVYGENDAIYPDGDVEWNDYHIEED